MSEDPTPYQSGRKPGQLPIINTPPSDLEQRMPRHRGEVGVALYMTNRMAGAFLRYVAAIRLNESLVLSEDDGPNVQLFLFNLSEMIERSYKHFPIQRLDAVDDDDDA